VTKAEVALLLAAASGRDQRTIGDADVLAWHEDIGDLPYDLARAALGRHYRESTDRIMPAHVRRLIRTIREERRGRELPSEPRALPGRFEDDVTRDLRVKEGVALCRSVLSVVMERLEANRRLPSGELDADGWCGRCNRDTRLAADEDDRNTRCLNCHPERAA